MRIAVFCTRPSTSARLLAAKMRELAPEGTVVKRVRRHGAIRAYDKVVVWGGHGLSKLEELRMLHYAGVPVPRFERFFSGPPDPALWLPRRAFHVGGQDFVDPPTSPAFYVERLDLRKEWRVHVMRRPDGGYEVLRSGVKVRRDPDAPAEGVAAWVRSDATGWRLSYGPTPAPAEVLEVALRAVEAMGYYDFGAVDMAKTADGRFLCLEVNSAPGLDPGGQTLRMYAEGILRLCV